MLRLLSNSRSSPFAIGLWITAAIFFLCVIPFRIPEIINSNRHDYFHVWPSNQFWEWAMVITISLTIVLALRFNWGPTLPTTAACAILSPSPENDIQFLVTGLMIGLALDFVTFYDSNSNLELDAADERIAAPRTHQ